MSSSDRISWEGAIPNWLSSQEPAVAQWLEEVVQERGFRLGRVSYTFLNDMDIRQRNLDLLEHDYATDIITLDHSGGRRRLQVEMFIGYEQIEDSSVSRGIPFDEELCRVLVHGLLHCMGWDDRTIEEQDKMRKEEDLCLISRPK